MNDADRFSRVLREWTEIFMHHSAQDFKRLMDEAGLSPTHLSILMRLLHGDKCAVSQVGGQLGITAAAASQAVERLVQMRLVERREDPADRRVRQLVLSDGGHVLLRRGIEARREWMERLTSALSPAQQAVIIDALTLLTQAARATDRELPAVKGRKP
jgi:DNA-binding MarR family transcriptional regulator